MNENRRQAASLRAKALRAVNGEYADQTEYARVTALATLAGSYDMAADSEEVVEEAVRQRVGLPEDVVDAGHALLESLSGLRELLAAFWKANMAKDKHSEPLRLSLDYGQAAGVEALIQFTAQLLGEGDEGP